MSTREGARILGKANGQPLKKRWMQWEELTNPEKYISPFGKIQTQIEELITESNITVFNIEPEMNFRDSLYPSRRMPEYWDRLGSSKSRSSNQQEE